MTWRKAQITAWLASALVLSAGCQAIAGIEDRELAADTDPDAGEDNSGGSGGGGGGGSGGSGGSDPGDGGQTDGGQSDGGEPTPCQTYCRIVDENCQDEYAVYANEGLCEEVCETLELGDLDEESPTGNTVACRLQQARFAGTTREPFSHCAEAGPGGAGVCGDDCESYCILFEEFCDGRDDVTVLDRDECVRKCGGLRDAADDRGSASDTIFDVDFHHDGDFLQCRLVHVSSAAAVPNTHCWHSEIVPRPLELEDRVDPNPCADPPETAPRCQDYCKLNLTACVDDLAQYESMQQCMDVCGTFDPGVTGDSGGVNNLGCRKAHSYNALAAAPETHCPHAGPGGDGVCGGNCESYCLLVADACADEFAVEFTDQDACVAACDSSLDQSDKYSTPTGDAGGDTFACRLLHTARAFDDEAACASALGGGDCQ